MFGFSFVKRSHGVAQTGLGLSLHAAPSLSKFFAFHLYTRFCFILAVALLNCHFACSQGSPNSHPSEELLKQPDYSDKLKQMLGNPQSQPPGPGEDALW